MEKEAYGSILIYTSRVRFIFILAKYRRMKRMKDLFMAYFLPRLNCRGGGKLKIVETSDVHGNYYPYRHLLHSNPTRKGSLARSFAFRAEDGTV